MIRGYGGVVHWGALGFPIVVYLGIRSTPAIRSSRSSLSWVAAPASEFTGFPGRRRHARPDDLQVLPRAERTGWVLCDAYISSGRPLPLDGRRLLRDQLTRPAEAGCWYLAGEEVEFSSARREDALSGLHETGARPPPSPRVDVFQQGYSYLSEVGLDGVNDTLTALRDALHAVALPPPSMDDEWGLGQMEFTSFDGGAGRNGSDGAVPQHRQAGLPTARIVGQLHVPTWPPEAPSPAAGTCTSRCWSPPARTCLPTRPRPCRGSAGRTSPVCSTTRTSRPTSPPASKASPAG